MVTPAANLALNGRDQIVSAQIDTHHFDSNYTALAHDPTVTFEEYVYWAKITRKDEKTANDQYLRARGLKTIKSWIWIPKGNSNGQHSPPVSAIHLHRIHNQQGISEDGGFGGTTPAEWRNASRALRTAGWGSIFYLITVDVLGPYSTPWAFAQMGYGPGIALFAVFGALSAYSGWILWRAHLGMDSDRYPLKGYGDFFFRIFGPKSRHFVNISQGIQILLTVSILILGIGQSISQISQGPNSGAGLCFIVCLLLFTLAGIILRQICTLQRLSWLTNFAIWINCLILFICIGVAANGPPNFHATEAQYGSKFGPGPIVKFAGMPPDGYASGGPGFIGALNGLNQAVFSYGGAMLFVAFLAEMRHPMDFWKGLLCAKLFIYIVYVFFGVFVYSYQGQYALNPAPQGLSPGMHIISAIIIRP